MSDLTEEGKLVQSQPGLFDEAGEPGLIETAEFKVAGHFSPVHTGRTTTRDQQRCVVAFDLLAAGVSRREISLRLGMSRNTLATVEDGGKLAPLKVRIQCELALRVSEATGGARESIARGTREIDDSVWLKALATTDGIDNHQIATGGPTEFVLQVGPDPRGLVDA